MGSSVVEPGFSAKRVAPGQRNPPPLSSRRPRPLQAEPPAPSRRPRIPLAPAEGWLVLLCLAVADYCVIYSITAVKWVDHTSILNWSAAFGLLLGLGVAKIRRYPQGIFHLAACLAGCWLSTWLTSSIALHVAWGSLAAAIGAVISDPTRINNNTIVFLFYLSFLSFFLGYFGAWLTYRAHLPWLVAMVYCAILLINLNYAQQDISSIVAVMLVALIFLIARVQLAAQLAQWQGMGLYTDRAWLRGITARIMKLASCMAMLTLVAGWVLPVLSQPAAGTTFWNNLDTTWANISQGHLSWQHPAALLQPDQAATNLFGDRLTIAGSVRLPRGEVLDYTSSAGPQYLAGFTYDDFDGHSWTSPASAGYQNYAAGAALPTAINLNYMPVSSSITLVQPPESGRHYIFGPTQPSSFTVSTTIYGAQLPTAWAQANPPAAGEHYQVASLLSTASARDLAAVPLPQENAGFWQADPNYDTLQSFYVQLPTDLSPRVGQTARQWTAGAGDAFDALRMLEAHLSNETQFTYSLENPPVPSQVDAVSWLLQTRRGYCTYYATAMTVMARQLHIPTRIVNGFTRGHLDQRRDVWVVDGSDAHSWVQAYFPAFGWINFDPTPGFSLRSAQPSRTAATPLTRARPTQPPTRVHATAGSIKTQPTQSAAGRGRGGPAQAAQGPDLNLLMALSLAALICALVMLSLALVRYWWLSLYPGSTFIAGKFWRLCRLASWAGLAPRSWQTPYEFSRLLCQRLPGEARPLWRLTELFVSERWAPHSASAAQSEVETLGPGLRRVFLRLLWRSTRLRRS
jgi:Transglutaminase-like superfamily/Domain of unknown function (DUF4129)